MRWIPHLKQIKIAFGDQDQCFLIKLFFVSVYLKNKEKHKVKRESGIVKSIINISSLNLMYRTVYEMVRILSGKYFFKIKVQIQLLTWSAVLEEFSLLTILSPSRRIFGSLDCSAMSSSRLTNAKLRKVSPKRPLLDAAASGLELKKSKILFSYLFRFSNFI